MIRYANYVESEQVTGPAVLDAGRIAAWISRQVEVGLSEGDLSLPQYRVLGLLAEGMALPSSMAERLDVRPPSITAVAEGLVSRGYVVRTHDTDDRRQVTHGITEEGRTALTAADRSVDARLSSIVGYLDNGAEITEALRGLALWGKALSNWRRCKVVSR
jgi:long-chain acyl-CoA synthetase